MTAGLRRRSFSIPGPRHPSATSRQLLPSAARSGALPKQQHLPPVPGLRRSSLQKLQTPAGCSVASPAPLEPQARSQDLPRASGLARSSSNSFQTSLHRQTPLQNSQRSLHRSSCRTALLEPQAPPCHCPRALQHLRSSRSTPEPPRTVLLLRHPLHKFAEIIQTSPPPQLLHDNTASLA